MMTSIIATIGTFFMSVVLFIGGHTGLFREAREMHVQNLYAEEIEQQLAEEGCENITVEWYTSKSETTLEVTATTAKYPGCKFVQYAQADFDGTSNEYFLTETYQMVYREGDLMYWHDILADEEYIDWAQALLMGLTAEDF